MYATAEEAIAEAGTQYVNLRRLLAHATREELDQFRDDCSQTGIALIFLARSLERANAESPQVSLLRDIGESLVLISAAEDSAQLSLIPLESAVAVTERAHRLGITLA